VPDLIAMQFRTNYDDICASAPIGAAQDCTNRIHEYLLDADELIFGHLISLDSIV